MTVTENIQSTQPLDLKTTWSHFGLALSETEIFLIHDNTEVSVFIFIISFTNSLSSLSKWVESHTAAVLTKPNVLTSLLDLVTFQTPVGTFFWKSFSVLSCGCASCADCTPRVWSMNELQRCLHDQSLIPIVCPDKTRPSFLLNLTSLCILYGV